MVQSTEGGGTSIGRTRRGGKRPKDQTPSGTAQLRRGVRTPLPDRPRSEWPSLCLSPPFSAKPRSIDRMRHRSNATRMYKFTRHGYTCNIRVTVIAVREYRRAGASLALCTGGYHCDVQKSDPSFHLRQRLHCRGWSAGLREILMPSISRYLNEGKTPAWDSVLCLTRRPAPNAIRTRSPVDRARSPRFA